MADSGTSKNSAPATKVVNAGRKKEWTGQVVNTPVWRASTHLYDSCADLQAGPKTNEDGRFFYGRRGSPTQWSLAEALTQMEPGAHGTILYPSGVAAIAGSLLAVLKPGDILLMSDNSYDPSRSMADNLLKTLGVTTRYFDPMIGSDIAELICDKTRAIWMETPGSLTFEVQDIPAICAAAKSKNPNIVTLLDNTWATSHFYTALEKGVDVVMNACTKYIVGHSDVMLGAATAGEKYYRKLRRTAQQLGHVVSPDDAYLASRGLRTLDVRLRQHQKSALSIAQWLATQDDVARVLHPALPSCPGHDIWKRDFTGSSGLFSFVMKGGSAAARNALIDALELFGIGYSWGGFESLALPVDPAPNRSATPWPRKGDAPEDRHVVRLNIGLEDPADLQADLAKGLEAFRLAL